MSAQRRPATKRDTSGSNSRRNAGGRQSGSSGQSATKARAQAAPKVDAVEAGGAAVAAAATPRVSASAAPASAPARAPKPAPAKAKDADAKPGALAERGGRIRKLFDDTRSEMKKITWPDKETTRNLTIVVIGISVVLGVALGGIDYVLFQIFEALP
jgi:preprotein translocase subunit SecE